MGNVASAQECMDLGGGKHTGNHRNHRSEHRGALITGREEHRLGERDDVFKVESKLLWITRLIKEGRSVLDQDLLGLGRDLCPGTRAERCFDELFGSTRMVLGSDAIHHSAEPVTDFLKQWRQGGIVREK